MKIVDKGICCVVLRKRDWPVVVQELCQTEGCTRTRVDKGAKQSYARVKIDIHQNGTAGVTFERVIPVLNGGC